MAYTNIDDPSAYFQTALFSGNGSTVVTVTNDGNSDLQPDLLWFKRRDSAVAHVLADTTKGANVTSGFGPTGYFVPLNPNSSASGVADSTGVMTITSDGFTVKEMTYASGNVSTGSMLCWQWHCNGGTTSSNTDGDITSTVQVNQDAGLSILTYSGTTGDVHTIGHGLGVTPDVWIVKQDNTGGDFQDWFFWHKDMAASNVVDNRMLFLNKSDAVGTYTGINAVTSSTIRVKSSTTAQNGKTYCAYVFAEKQGYSKFGKYRGNSHSGGDGPFVYTGFAPSWVMIKKTDSANDWIVHDYKLGTIASTGSEKGNLGNANTAALRANETSAVDGWGSIDMLSNGFKVRSAGGASENVTAPYIYMAFAEHPFVTSTGVPATAR